MNEWSWSVRLIICQHEWMKLISQQLFYNKFSITKLTWNWLFNIIWNMFLHEHEIKEIFDESRKANITSNDFLFSWTLRAFPSYKLLFFLHELIKHDDIKEFCLQIQPANITLQWLFVFMNFCWLCNVKSKLVFLGFWLYTESINVKN